MKRIVVCVLFVLFAGMLFAQADVAAVSVLNENRLETIRIHALILGIWAMLNISIGGYLTYVLYDGEPESFHHMNAAWNLVNIGVVWAMIYAVNHADIASYDLLTTVNKHFQAQKLMMLNIGLDVSYMVAGLALLEHSKHNEKFHFVLRGFGKSIILQGAFLFLLDVTFYSIHASQNAVLREILQSFPANASI